jgi:hypothetical protein
MPFLVTIDDVGHSDLGGVPTAKTLSRQGQLTEGVTAISWKKGKDAPIKLTGQVTDVLSFSSLTGPFWTELDLGSWWTELDPFGLNWTFWTDWIVFVLTGFFLY